ncbi:LysM domain-containing protein [Pseudanabaena sp. FACHB-2040]|uniref:LysM domain-containing protein n=1 Tax=Pseudanabaena sp. FACHB-2040 TaxID=2692859 RepID=UPI00168559AE|nr:LysM domain-containing protein [Pseudanabaena sp. FACHB-2040]MBD2261428.1 LysM domain-containing protein [Pseudanabaena sp. FACHB-2040]
MFPPTSRYAQTETAQLTTAAGRQVVYLRRRFLPKTMPPTQAEHKVVEGDRIDNITAQYLGDPEQFWRVCDANRAMHPDEMTAEIGRTLDIPLILGG